MSDHYVCPCPDGCNGCEVLDFAIKEIERLQARVDELEERIEKLLASKFAASSPKLIAKIITLASEVEK